MPLYEYRCDDCDHRFEVLQRIGEGPEGLLCPSCGRDDHLEKQFSTFAASGGESASMSSMPAGGCGQGGFS